MTPRFSVLIPAHRAARFLPTTLASLAAQTEREWELLIFEDGRLDNTAAVVKAATRGWPQFVSQLGQPEKSGVSRARNALLRVARGPWIAFLDADDVWEPDHLADARRNLEEGADVVISGVTLIDVDDSIIESVAHPTPDVMADPAPSLFRYNFVQCTSTLTATRRALERAGEFDEKLTHGEDLDLWLRLTWAGVRWAHTGQRTCHYRKHPQGAMADPILVSERLADFYEKHFREERLPRALREECLKAALLNLGRMTWREQPARAASAFRRLARSLPCLKSRTLWLAALANSFVPRKATTR